MRFTKLKIAAAALTGVAVASVAMMPLAPAQTQSTDPIPAQEKGQRKESIEQPAAAAVQQMIDQLASPKFAEREAAAKELGRIGEPALAQLRQAGREGKELEVRRRATQVVRAILDDTIERLLKEETREDEIYCKKVVKILERVTDVGKERLDADRGTTPQENVLQLQFDNGRGDRTFQVNMVVGQKNTVADLGMVDFNIDPSLTKADLKALIANRMKLLLATSIWKKWKTPMAIGFLSSSRSWQLTSKVGT